MRRLLALLLVAAPAQAAEVWEGTYGCTQGTTGLTLTIDPAPDGPAPDGTASASALFHFYAAPDNPGVPEGCFTMSGTLDRSTGFLHLNAGRWLLRPDGYVTVDLDGALHEGGTALYGNVSGPGCSIFLLRRVARPLRPTSACYPAALS